MSVAEGSVVVQFRDPVASRLQRDRCKPLYPSPEPTPRTRHQHHPTPLRANVCVVDCPDKVRSYPSRCRSTVIADDSNLDRLASSCSSANAAPTLLASLIRTITPPIFALVLELIGESFRTTG